MLTVIRQGLCNQELGSSMRKLVAVLCELLLLCVCVCVCVCVYARMHTRGQRERARKCVWTGLCLPHSFLILEAGAALFKLHDPRLLCS